MNTSQPEGDSAALAPQGEGEPSAPPGAGADWLRSSRAAPALWGLCALALVVAGLIGTERPLDGDEGFYATAASLVAGGALPHRDFFYTQAPLAPFLYAPVELLAGREILALRALSLAWLGLTWAALLAWLGRRLSSTRAQLLSGALLVTSGGLISWSVVFKTYAAANAGIALGLYCLWRGYEGQRRWFVAAGAAWGLAAGVRLFGIVPWGAAGLVALACAFRGGPELRAAARRAILPLGGGCALGLLPTLGLVTLSPAQSWFGMVEYHTLRSTYPPLPERLGALARLAFRVAREQPHLLLLALLAGWGVLCLRRRWSDLEVAQRLAWLSTGGILLAYSAALATLWPVFPQYYTATLPLLLLPFAAMSSEDLLRRPLVALLVVIVACGAGVYGLSTESARYSARDRWRVEAYRRICAAVAAQTPPSGRVVAFWPGYTYGSGRAYYPGAVNDFSLHTASHLSPADRERFHTFGIEDLIASLSGPERAETLVAGDLPPGLRETSSREALGRLAEAIRGNYRQAEVVEGVPIWVRADR